MFVNGVQAGGHTGGYDAFSFDITDLLKKEQGAEQELLVVVEDPTESQVFRFFLDFWSKSISGDSSWKAMVEWGEAVSVYLLHTDLGNLAGGPTGF